MLNHPFALSALNLSRFPKSNDTSLKAWNAADEYLLDWCNNNLSKTAQSTLIINDQFGALTCSLNELKPYYWTDSFLSYTAIQNNLNANQLEQNLNHINQSDRLIDGITSDVGLKFDLVIIRVPKHNSLLAYQLESIRPFVHPKTTLIAAGMTKEIHKSTLKLFESIIGPTTTSLAKKKARMIFPQYQLKSENSNQHQQQTAQFIIKSNNLVSYGYPGVFSRESLDIGSRVLLQYLPETQTQQQLIDLGCGTGVLGTSAALRNPSLKVTFTDESWLAIRSAEKTFLTNTNSSASYKVTNVLEGLPDNQYDYVLCNPPFHQQNVQTLAIANKMFADASKKLRASGELRVVANRHLKYQGSLSRYFNEVKIISKDSKFIVWLARKPRK